MTIDDIQRLIQNDETRTLELKKTTGELKDGMRSACAFLNTAGGWLLFGIAPTTLQILGQQVTESTRREIAHELTKLEPSIDLPVEYVDIPGREGFQVIAIRLDGASFGEMPYTYDGKPYLRVESTTIVMPRDIAIYDDRVEIENTGHLPEELTVETIKTNHQSFAQNPLIADILFKTTFLENWGSGVSRMMEAGLPEPKYGTNGLFVWITFYRTTSKTVQPQKTYNLESIQPRKHTTSKTHNFKNIQPHNLKTPQPQNPTTSNKKARRIKALLSIIGDKGANLKTLMEVLRLRDRKNLLYTYINPNVEEGNIAMLYPEKPNHPMQSYYLTQKGRELLEKLSKEE